MANSSSFRASADLAATGNANTCPTADEAGLVDSVESFVAESLTVADCCGKAQVDAERNAGSSRTTDFSTRRFIFNEVRGMANPRRDNRLPQGLSVTSL